MSSISKPLALAVQMLMISGALAGLFTGAGADEGKAGARAVILIHDVYELQNMSLDLNGSYELANDIDASATVNWNNGSGFLPVGPGNAYCFNGSLDGKNHVITGLFINRSNTDNVGLFGVIDSGDVVKNIGIVDENVTGRYEIGGLAGMCWGSVDNAYATGVVNGVDCVGGLIGWNINSTVDNSYAAVNVNGNIDYSTAGGLVARNDGGRVNNSYATGNVTGRCGVGGLVGYNDDWYGDIATVNNSYATGDVVGTGWEVGGLVGEILSGTVDNSYATGNVTGNKDNVGGLVGLVSDYEGNLGSVFNSYATGNVNGEYYVGGLVGWLNNATISNSHYNIDKMLINGKRFPTVGGLLDGQYHDWFDSNLSLKISDYNTSLVSSEGFYDISDVQGLKDLLGFADLQGYKFRLAADIDLSADPGVYIPYISAEFDGNNHIVSNLSINIPFAGQVGMFGYSYGGTIENIGVVDFDINGYSEVGGLVGSNYGAVNNAHTAGNMRGSYTVGGLVGYNYHCEVNYSYSTATVHGDGYAGGLVGINKGSVNNSYATGNVIVSYRYAGGLVGDNWGSVDHSHATGNVTGEDYTGGLVGLVVFGTVDNSYATGNVGGGGFVGGLIGYFSNTLQDHGTLKSSTQGCTVESSYATGNVTGTGDFVGGLMGSGCEAKNSFATGNVTGINYVGGLVGYLQVVTAISLDYALGNVGGFDDQYTGSLVASSGNVSNSYSAGKVSGSSDLGGLVGNNSGTVSNCFWDNETSGQKTSSGGTGKNTTEMKTRSTFTSAGWDFDTIWNITENETYPILRDTGGVPHPPANHPPTIITSPEKLAYAETLYTVEFLASDPDGDSLNWTMTSNASWLSMTGDGLLSGTPSSADLGTFIVAITVSDGKGGTASLTFELAVSARHLISWTDVPGNASLTEGDDYTFSAKANDNYPEYTLAYSVTSAENCTLSINSSTGAIQWLNVTAGTYHITLGATDGELTISHDFVLFVARKHTISWTEVPGDANLTEGDNYTFTASATDTYPELVLSYSVTPAENSALTVNSSTGAIQWLNVTAGRYPFTLSATDGELTITHDFVLSVAKKHTIAWTEVPGDTNLTEGDNYTFTASATDTYPELVLSYSVTPAENSALTVNSSTGAIQWLNVTAGNHSFTLSATDGELTISHDFVLSVARKQEPFLAPYIVSVTGPENITVKASSVQTFSVEATSPSGANLTYAWTENGVTLSTEKTFSRKFPPGNHTLILLIGDGRYTTTRTFNFTVAPPPKTISAKPFSIPGFEAGVVAVAIAAVVAIGLFLRRERK